MHLINWEQLQEWNNIGKEYVLIDVREPFEHQEYNIGGVNIPLADIINQMNLISHDLDIVLYCAKGIRSGIAIQRLESKGYTRLYNLRGGINQMTRKP